MPLSFVPLLRPELFVSRQFQRSAGNVYSTNKTRWTEVKVNHRSWNDGLYHPGAKL
jgi:hypothetical protein